MALTSDPPIDPQAGTDPGERAAVPDHTDLKVVPLRHPWRWVAVVATAVLLAQFLNGLVTNPGWEWDVFARFITAEAILNAVWVTIQLTFYGTVIGFALGIVLAFMRLSDSPFLRGSRTRTSGRSARSRSSSSCCSGSTSPTSTRSSRSGSRSGPGSSPSTR